MPSLVQGVPAVEGLWRYRGIAIRGGARLDLDGFFLLRGGRFVQQSLNAGEPFTAQLAQAHAGTYAQGDEGLTLSVDVGVVIDPPKPSIDVRNGSTHKIRVSRAGDEMTFTFGSGTVQHFSRLGRGEGDVVTVEGGAFATADDRFLLVVQRPTGWIGGSGSFTRRGTALTLSAERWFTTDGSAISYQRDTTIDTTFGGTVLSLPGGVSLPVIPKDAHRR
jgi:hypothetical protein